MDRRPVVLFDLDGTLSDSATSILTALRAAVADHGLPALDPATERALLGPPFRDSFREFVPDAEIETLLQRYREHYAHTRTDTVAFPGTAKIVAALRAAGSRVGIATSKNEPDARTIVAHLGIDVDEVTGDTLEGTRGSKADVVAEALLRFGSPAPGEVIMVGDRRHDVEGARAHGIDCIAVRWGFAPPGELEQVAPAVIVDDAAQLAEALGV